MMEIFDQARQLLNTLAQIDNFFERAQQGKKVFQQGEYSFIGTR